MTPLELACEEIYMTIYNDIEHYCQDNHNDIDEDELDEMIEDMFNNDVFTDTENYDEIKKANILCAKNMFEIVKIVSKVCRGIYNMTFNIETIEKTIDLYAYLCAKEIAHTMIIKYKPKQQ